jgi:hypothetical protein
MLCQTGRPTAVEAVIQGPIPGTNGVFNFASTSFPRRAILVSLTRQPKYAAVEWTDSSAVRRSFSDASC